MQEQAQALIHAVSIFRLSGGYSTPTTVKRSNRATAVTKLPNRGPATRRTAVKSEPDVRSLPEQPRKVAAGGGDDNWEEF